MTIDFDNIGRRPLRKKAPPPVVAPRDATAVRPSPLTPRGISQGDITLDGRPQTPNEVGQAMGTAQPSPAPEADTARRLATLLHALAAKKPAHDAGIVE